jgi:hypothetical protein
MDVGVVLAEKIGKEPMVVEVEFERIFGGWLRNGFAKASCRLFAGWRSRKQGRFVRRVARIVPLFAFTFKARLCDAQIKRAVRDKL